MLKVSNLVVNYGQSEALHGISFAAQRNEAVAIMGRNGMGKTTLFKSLMGVLPLRSGSVEVDGVEVGKDESYRRVAKGIAYAVMGGLFIWAAASFDPEKVGGLDRALETIRYQPLGNIALIVMAVGIACYGIWCFYWAMHAKHA